MEVGADGLGILDLLLKSGLAPSKAEARRLVAQGGIAVDGRRVAQPSETVGVRDFKKADGTYLILKKGKKVYHKVILAGDPRGQAAPVGTEGKSD